MTIWWKRTQVWVLLWLSMWRVSFPYVRPTWSMRGFFGSVLDALDAVLSMCLFYISMGSRARLSIFWGGVFMPSVLLLICR